MNVKQQAARELQRLGNQLKGIIALGDELEKLGSLDQAALEAESRIKELQGREAELRQAAEAATASIAEAEATARGIVVEAEQRAVRIVEAAENDARRALEESESRAKDVESEAAARVEALEKDSKAQTAKIKAADAEIRRREVRLEELQFEIDRIKAQFS